MSLQEELVNEILARLPAKSLLRFKNVERSWNTLFKTKSFIRRQKEMQMRSASSHDRFIMFYHEVMTRTPTITVLSTCYPPKYENLEYPLSDPTDYLVYLQALGHYNGIYCLRVLYFNGKFPDGPYLPETILWNPTIRELYDFNTDSWSVIHDVRDNSIRFKTSFHDCGFYSNGVYHWLSSDYTFILCFDFHSNKLRTIKTPLTTEYCTIIEANNCIAYLAYDTSDDQRIEIWYLKQDGSWIKQCNLTPVVNGGICTILKDGAEFLGGPIYDVMTLYKSRPETPHDSRAEALRRFQVLAEDGHFGIYPYVETIVPLSP
ncbi:hypothetical protein Lal_00028686 [Lupinus albus]|nr:hypothetical protein Lal_00028686 [Lupinus albus]